MYRWIRVCSVVSVLLVMTLGAAPAGGSTAAALSDPFFDKYQKYDAIAGKLQTLAAANQGRARVQSIGTTHEGRAISMITIGGQGETGSRMLITCGQQAREWISVAVCVGVADYLLANYTTLPPYIRAHPIDIVPVVNPDGYEYSHTTDRRWQKNRRSGASCRGVNLDRNFAYNFGSADASSDPCDDIYRGPSAFSEPESRAIRDLALTSHYKTSIAFHSYGQQILYPWHATLSPPANRENLARIGAAIRDTMTASSGTTWVAGQSSTLLGTASGTEQDWLYNNAGVTLPYLIELRPEGDSDNGFILPPAEIRPSIIEAQAAVDTLLQNAP